MDVFDTDPWTAFYSNLPATLIALGALLASLGSFMQGWRNGRKADAAKKQAEVAAKLASAADGNIIAIRTNTDGSLSELRQEIAVARKEIEGLHAARELAAVQTALETPVPPSAATRAEPYGD